MPAKAVDDPLIDLVRDAMEASGTVSARRLFGGAGIYSGETCFALLSRGVLYFKVSEATKRKYEAEGSKPFGYTTNKGRSALTSYYRVPDRLLDEPEELAEWAREAVKSANSVKNATSRSGGRSKPRKR